MRCLRQATTILEGPQKAVAQSQVEGPLERALREQTRSFLSPVIASPRTADPEPSSAPASFLGAPSVRSLSRFLPDTFWIMTPDPESNESWIKVASCYHKKDVLNPKHKDRFIFINSLMHLRKLFDIFYTSNSFLHALLVRLHQGSAT